jgi:phosphate transport system substrate-binding protein
MSRIPFFCLATLFVLIFNTAHAQTEPKPIADYEKGNIIHIHGSNTLGAKLVPAWAEQYLRALGVSQVQRRSLTRENELEVHGRYQQREISIRIAAHGSSTGFRALANANAHVAMSSRPIKESEVRNLAELGDMRKLESEHVVAIDGLAVIVHPSNTIDALTIDEIASIFSGDIHNWAQLGGSDKPIELLARDQNSGTWDTFKSLVLAGRSLSASARRFESNDQLSDLVANSTNAIGFVGLASVREAKALAISDSYTQPLAPEVLHVATEDYPLARRLYFYTAENQSNPRTRDFLKFVQGAAAQTKVDDIGFVSLNPRLSQRSSIYEGPESYRTLADHAQRLSVNFRFSSGSARLDNRAMRDIERVAAFLKSEQASGMRVQLIGFGDLKQKERRAVLLSKLRASEVKAALFKHGVVSETVVGFGTHMPVASNLGSNRHKNQRVEIWLYEDAKHPLISQAKKSAHLERQNDTAKFGLN